MSTGRPPQGSIPTLTEVVPWPSVATATTTTTAAPVAVAVEVPAAATPVLAIAAAAPLQAATPPVAPAATMAAAISEAELTQRVLADVQKQIDMVLEVRLREALAPALARASDALVRDARKELTSALRDVVARSVAHELGRKR